MARSCVVLLSGGLDSSVLLGRSLGDSPTAVIVDYGQRGRAEIECARRIAAAMSVPVAEVSARLPVDSMLTALVDVPTRTLEEMRTGPSPYVVPGRNAVLLSIAASVAESVGADEVLFGANADDQTGFPDCRPSFVEAMSQVVGASSSGRVSVRAPLVEWDKVAIVREANRIGYSLPVEQTCSCYVATLNPMTNEPIHCGRCDACTLRRWAFERAEVYDPTTYRVDL